MRLDQVLARLAPDAQYRFITEEQSYFSRKLGEVTSVMRTEHTPILDSYEAIIWEDVTIQPTLIECEVEWAVMQRELVDIGVDVLRRTDYGTIESQLDMMWHDERDGTTLWADHVLEVKNRHPKD